MASNCISYALKRWFPKAKPGQERYLIFRRSRLDWGFFHALYGELDPETNQIRVTSYKPPEGHVKAGVAFTFEGAAREGDLPTDFTKLDANGPGKT